MFLNNEKGMSLLGTMIAAAVGLVVTMGISKSIIKFAEQTTKTNRGQIVTQIEGNLTTLMRTKRRMWDVSVGKAKKLGCSYPGQKGKCPMKLYRNPEPSNPALTKLIACPSGKPGEAVGFFSTGGSLVALKSSTCKKCKSDANCGLDPRKYIKYVMSYKGTSTAPDRPTGAEITQIPDFNGKIEDRGGSKKIRKLASLSDSEGVLVHPDIFRCPANMHVKGVNQDGSPVCEQTFKNIDCSGGGQILVGIKPNGTPDCRTLNIPEPKVTLDNSCSGGQYVYKVANNRAFCRKDQKGTSTTTIVQSGGGSSGPSCYGSGTLPRDSYLHTSGGPSSNWGGCSNQGLACGKSNGNSAKCCSGTAQWMYPSGCDSAPKCYCN